MKDWLTFMNKAEFRIGVSVLTISCCKTHVPHSIIRMISEYIAFCMVYIN